MRKKQRLVTALLIFSAISIVVYTPVSAETAPGTSHNYQFNSGPDTTATFGSPTMTDVPGSNPLLDNIRRNKDVAYLPPSYGIFGGDLPTNPSSLYHSADSTASATAYTLDGTASVNYYEETTGALQSTSVINTPEAVAVPANISINYTTANPAVTSPMTQPSFYSDGSIGFLSIPAINTYVQVYEGETTANLKLGAAHFENTSSWDGNIGLAGHNRGAHDFFRGVKDLMIGDLITYDTMHGTRTYQVFLKERITETDFSHLGWSRENLITLITCVIDTPGMRWVIQARQI